MFLCLCVVFLPFSVGRCVSLDCEMVGTGSAGDFSMLARCSIVNHHGNVLYNSYVAPMDKITDYRTKFSGITSQHLRGGIYIVARSWFTQNFQLFDFRSFYFGTQNPCMKYTTVQKFPAYTMYMIVQYSMHVL